MKKSIQSVILMFMLTLLTGFNSLWSKVLGLHKVFGL